MWRDLAEKTYKKILRSPTRPPMFRDLNWSPIVLCSKLFAEGAWLLCLAGLATTTYQARAESRYDYEKTKVSAL
jgi:hypothetical protein